MVFAELQTLEDGGDRMKRGRIGQTGGWGGDTAVLRKPATIETCIQTSKSSKREGEK